MCLKKSQDNFQSITNELHATAIALPSNVGVGGGVWNNFECSWPGIEKAEFEIWI
jgi:hypothetical protein